MLASRLVRRCGARSCGGLARACNPITPPRHVLLCSRASSSARSTANGHHSTAPAVDLNEAARALPGVAWGLAYRPPSAGNGTPSPGPAPDLPEAYRDLDAIVVLAGGQTGPESLPPWVERRLDTALSLQRMQRRPCPILSLGGGTPHKGPYLDARGFVVHESTACARYLLGRGADASLLLKEVSSYDTVGNAYFALTSHSVPAGWRRLGVVTSDFHMPRTAALFHGMFGMAGRELFGQPDRFELVYVASSDAGIFEPEILEIRKSKEAASQASWERTLATLGSLPQLHHWLHHSHLCYAVGRQEEFGKQTITDPKLLASY